MKKIIILLMLTCFGLKSQTNIYNAYIVKADIDSACNGIKLHFTYHLDSSLIANFPNVKADLNDSLSTFESNGYTVTQLRDSNYIFTLNLNNAYMTYGNHKFYTGLDLQNHKAVNFTLLNCTTDIKQYHEEIKYEYYYYDLGLYKLKINLQTKEKTIE